MEQYTMKGRAGARLFWHHASPVLTSRKTFILNLSSSLNCLTILSYPVHSLTAEMISPCRIW